MQKLKKISLALSIALSMHTADAAHGAMQYTVGARFDTINLGSVNGTADFSGYTEPGTEIDTLEITVTGTGHTHNVPTTQTIPSHIKTIRFLINATDPNLVFTANDNGFMPPPEGATIEFKATAASIAGSEHPFWFAGVIPSSCKVVVQADSVDPFLGNVISTPLKYLQLGASIALSEAGTVSAPIVRANGISDSEAPTKAQISLPNGTSVFTASVQGVSFAGSAPGAVAEFQSSASVIRPNVANLALSTSGANARLKVQMPSGSADLATIGTWLAPLSTDAGSALQIEMK